MDDEQPRALSWGVSTAYCGSDRSDDSSLACTLPLGGQRQSAGSSQANALSRCRSAMCARAITNALRAAVEEASRALTVFSTRAAESALPSIARAHARFAIVCTDGLLSAATRTSRCAPCSVAPLFTSRIA